MRDEGPVTVPVSKSVTAVHRMAITDSKTGEDHGNVYCITGPLRAKHKNATKKIWLIWED